VEPFAGMLGFCYSSTAVLREEEGTERTENPLEPTGRPGFRAPDVAITRNGSTNQSTVDLFGHGWVLLTASGGEPWRDAAADISAEICVGIACHIEGTDFTGELFAARYGLDDGGAALVRPDGMVAWRTKDAVEDAAGTLWNVFGRVLSR
jgi:aklavinone 12-hydroxylase